MKIFLTVIPAVALFSGCNEASFLSEAYGPKETRSGADAEPRDDEAIEPTSVAGVYLNHQLICWQADSLGEAKNDHINCRLNDSEGSKATLAADQANWSILLSDESAAPLPADSSYISQCAADDKCHVSLRELPNRATKALRLDIAAQSFGKSLAILDDEPDVVAAETTATRRMACEVQNATDQLAQELKVSGRNWSVISPTSPDGGAYDDYHVTFTGQFRADGYRLYSLADQDIQVRYVRGADAITTQLHVSLQFIQCSQRKQPRFRRLTLDNMNTFSVKKGERLNIYTDAWSGTLLRNYNLIEHEDRAYKITIIR